MRLPDELLAAIADETGAIDSRELAAAAVRLTERYKAGEFTAALTTRADRAAYLAVRMPATFAAGCRLFRAIRERLPHGDYKSLLDLGAGPGTAMWAATETGFNFDDFACLERNQAIAELGQRLGSRSTSAAVRSARWLPSDLSHIRDLPHYDMVSFFFVLKELPDIQQQTAVRAAWLKTGSLLLLVEPGTPDGFRRIHAARTLLLESGAHLVAPCPHRETCPMFAMGDWCHFAARVERTSEHRRLKSGSLGYEDEKFSYLVVSKQPASLPDSRILRRPLIHPGYMRLTLCRPGHTELRTVTKSQKTLWRYARRIEWGSDWQPPIDRN